jgi:lysozyme
MGTDDVTEAAARRFGVIGQPCVSVSYDMNPSPVIDVVRAKPSAACREVVAHFEQGPNGGHAMQPYFCSAGACTIGYGHVIRKGETFSYPMTRATANDLLDSDLDRFDDEVKALLLKLGVKTLTQGQYDALVSMAFNLGTGVRDNKKGDFADSDLINFVAQGRMIMAAAQFPLWKFAGGKVLPGLVRRRQCERHLFTTGLVEFFQAR